MVLVTSAPFATLSRLRTSDADRSAGAPASAPLFPLRVFAAMDASFALVTALASISTVPTLSFHARFLKDAYHLAIFPNITASFSPVAILVLADAIAKATVRSPPLPALPSLLLSRSLMLSIND